MANATHAEHGHHEHVAPNPIVTGIGVGTALAMGWLLALIMPPLVGAPRFAVGITMAIIGMLWGTASNASNAFPNLQRFMETFGFSLFAFGLVRYFNLFGILGKADGFIGSIGKFLTLFM
jgi:hypothetical protein